MNWKPLKRGLAVVLSVLLITSSVPVYADETEPNPMEEQTETNTPAETEVVDDSGSENESGEKGDAAEPEETEKTDEPESTGNATTTDETEGTESSGTTDETEGAGSSGTTDETEGTESSGTTDESAAESTAVESTEEETTGESESAAESTAVEPTEEETTTESTVTEATEEETTTESTVTETTEEETTEEETTEETTELETETETEEVEIIAFEDIEDVVMYNTGSREIHVIPSDVYSDDLFELCLEDNIVVQPFNEDGSFTIEAEADAFFPYEVQFQYDDRTENRWFLSPYDRTSVNGHTFSIHSEFSADAVTQMSLSVAGRTVTVYPKEKVFTNDGGISTYSLMPLEEKYLTVDLSEFTPIELTMISMTRVFQGERELNETNKITWVYQSDDGDDFTISSPGDKLDFSYRTCYEGSTRWQMIVGSGDQLDKDNIRYNVTVRTKESNKWLNPILYTQDGEGVRKVVPINSSNYRDDNSDDRTWRRLSVTGSGDIIGDAQEVYLKLVFNSEVFGNEKFTNIKVYEGHFLTANEAQQSGKEITNQILNMDMAQRDAGYLVKISTYSDYPSITMVACDSSQNVIGCLPVKLSLFKGNSYISGSSLYQRTEGGGWNYVSRRTSYDTSEDGMAMRTITLERGYPANGRYCLELTYYKDSQSSNSDVTAAYVGKHNSITEARAVNAEEVKASLFNDDYSTGGYEADFSQGITFSIFIGKDGAEKQEKYYYHVKTVEDTSEPSLNILSPVVYFDGLKGADNNDIAVYSTKYNMDSYSQYEFLTMLVEPNVDLTNVAPKFYFASDYESAGMKLYAAGSSTPEVSGESFHDFSKGAIQYTVATQQAVDGKDYSRQKNYWLQIIKADSDASKLYVNSLADPDSNTWTDENGVIHSKREIHIDSYQGDYHDILLINMGTEALKGLSAELTSDNLVMDDYWRLSGQFELSGYSTIEREPGKPHGELPNMAKIRLRAQEGKESNSDDLGTLTIKLNGSPVMIFALTGSVGDPHITTQEIPQAVKYVPYGTVIQNNNKYDWNTVVYRQTGGSLPAGMQILQSGELYGVPKEEGTFTFEVTMYNSSSSFHESVKTFTLEVLPNTDENVDNATDDGYTLSTRLSRTGTAYLVVSEGVFSNFKYIYLDGERLEESVDYDAESGSTRITIRSETLSKKGAGVHTLGIEFREGGEDSGELKRAAQNYDAEQAGIVQDSSNNNSSSSNSSNSGSSSSNSSNNSNPGSSAANASVKNSESVEVVPVQDVASKDGYNISQADVSRDKVLNAGLLNKFYGQYMYLNVIFGADFGLTIDMTDIPIMSTDVKIEYKLVTDLMLTPEFDVIHAIPDAIKPLEFKAIFNFHVGDEYVGKKAYIYVLNELGTGYNLARVSVVNEIGNVAFVSANVSDVIILIEK